MILCELCVLICQQYTYNPREGWEDGTPPPAYANGVGVLDGASHAVEVDGGNLNYAFRVSCADGNSIFLKQTPGFVKARSFIPLSA